MTYGILQNTTLYRVRSQTSEDGRGESLIMKADETASSLSLKFIFIGLAFQPNADANTRIVCKILFQSV